MSGYRCGCQSGGLHECQYGEGMSGSRSGGEFRRCQLDERKCAGRCDGSQICGSGMSSGCKSDHRSRSLACGWR